jgi:hypothetical protein
VQDDPGRAELVLDAFGDGVPLVALDTRRDGLEAGRGLGRGLLTGPCHDQADLG